MLLSIFFALVSLWWVFSNIQICVHTFLVEFLFSFFSSLVLETGVFYEVWVECWVELYFPRLFNFPRSDLRTRVTFLFRGQRISQRSWAGRAREDVYVEWEAEMRSTIKTAPATPRLLSLRAFLFEFSGTIFVLNFWQKTSWVSSDTEGRYSVHVWRVGWFLVSTWL